MGEKRRVRDHFVVNELVAFGRHDQTVEQEDAPERVGVDDVQGLEFASPEEF